MHSVLSRWSWAADAVTSLMMIQLDIDKSHILSFAPSFEMSRLKLQYLMILLYCLPWAARAGLPVESSATTVATTALHKEASWEEDCVGQLQLLPEIHRVIPGSATVTLDIIIEPVQVHFRLPFMVWPASITRGVHVQILQIILPRRWIEVLKQIFYSIEFCNSFVQGIGSESGVHYWWRVIGHPRERTCDWFPVDLWGCFRLEIFHKWIINLESRFCHKIVIRLKCDFNLVCSWSYPWRDLLMATPSSSDNSAAFWDIFNFHKVIPTNVIFCFLQSKLMVKGQLYPCFLLGMEPPCQEQVPRVAVGEARTLHVASACHPNVLISPVQVISPEVGIAQSFDGCALRSRKSVPIAAKVRTHKNGD